jgi:hypothetical protein
LERKLEMKEAKERRGRGATTRYGTNTSTGSFTYGMTNHSQFGGIAAIV